MNPQIFKTLIGDINKSWVSEILGVPLQKDGIDLENDEVAIEVKSKLRRRGYARHFAIADYQLGYQNEEKEFFWALVKYSLTKGVGSIRKKDRIEGLLRRREVYIKPWDFVRRFPVADVPTGPYRYVRLEREDKTTNAIRVDGGIIYLPENFKKKKLSFPGIKNFDL